MRRVIVFLALVGLLFCFSCSEDPDFSSFQKPAAGKPPEKQLEKLKAKAVLGMLEKPQADADMEFETQDTPFFSIDSPKSWSVLPVHHFPDIEYQLSVKDPATNAIFVAYLKPEHQKMSGDLKDHAKTWLKQPAGNLLKTKYGRRTIGPFGAVDVEFIGEKNERRHAGYAAFLVVGTDMYSLYGMVAPEEYPRSEKKIAFTIFGNLVMKIFRCIGL